MTWRGPGTTWDGGKSDDGQIQEAARIVAECLTGYEIEIEPTLWLPFDGAPPFTISSDGTDSFIVDPEHPASSPDGQYALRHPDVAVLDGNRAVLLVELDGSWHDTVPGRKATDRRDRDYRAANIPFIAIRLSEYPDGWQPELRRRLKCMKYIPPLGRADGE